MAWAGWWVQGSSPGLADGLCPGWGITHLLKLFIAISVIYLWSKAELLHDGREEEEEFSFGKTLSKALPFPCKDHSSSIIYGSLITYQNLANTIWLKRYTPIENGMRCSSLRTFPSLSRNLSGLNSSPSSQWLPCFAYMNDLFYTQWYQSSYWIYKLSKQ